MPAETQFKKKDILAACRGTMGIQGNLCKRLRVSRRTLYAYRKRWPEIDQAMAEEREDALDLAEAKLMKLVSCGDFRAISFCLERMGASRGWGDSKTIDMTSGGERIQPVICFGAPEEGGGAAENGTEHTV